MNSLTRLQNELSAIYAKKTDQVKALSSILSLSERAIYNRVDGKTEFSLSELEKIFTELNISPQSVFSVDNLEIEKIIKSKDFRGYINFILQSWVSQTEKLNGDRDNEVFIISNSVPFSLVFEYPSIVKFRLYFLLKFVFRTQDIYGLGFDLNASYFEEVNQACEKISESYNKTDSIEVWGPSMIRVVVRQLSHLKRVKLIAKEDLQTVMMDLSQLLDQAQKFAQTGIKEFDSCEGNRRFDLYINDIYAVDEYTILTYANNGKTKDYIYSPLHGEISEEVNKQAIKEYGTLLEESGTYLSKSNTSYRNVYFKELRQYLKTLSTERTYTNDA